MIVSFFIPLIFQFNPIEVICFPHVSPFSPLLHHFSPCFTIVSPFFTFFHHCFIIFTIVHHFSPLLTIFHNFSSLFSIFHPCSPLLHHFSPFFTIVSPFTVSPLLTILHHFSPLLHHFSFFFNIVHHCSPLFTIDSPFFTIVSQFFTIVHHCFTIFHFFCNFSEASVSWTFATWPLFQSSNDAFRGSWNECRERNLFLGHQNTITRYHTTWCCKIHGTSIQSASFWFCIIPSIKQKPKGSSWHQSPRPGYDGVAQCHWKTSRPKRRQMQIVIGICRQTWGPNLKLLFQKNRRMPIVIGICKEGRDYNWKFLSQKKRRMQIVIGICRK